MSAADDARLGMKREISRRPPALTGMRGSHDGSSENAHLDRAHSIRVSSTVELPYRIQLGRRSVYGSGRPYGRLIIVRGLAQGTTNVLAQPRAAYELPSRNDPGIRVGKDIALGARMLRLSLDIQNLLNDDAPLSIDNQQLAYGVVSRPDADLPAAGAPSSAFATTSDEALCHRTNRPAAIAISGWLARLRGAIS